MGEAIYSGLRDARVEAEDPLDLTGVDILAVGDDHVLLAADDGQISIGSDRGEVAGLEPAVLEGLTGRRTVLVISSEDRHAPDPHLADGPVIRRDVDAAIVDDPHLDALERPPRGGDQDEALVRGRCSVRCRQQGHRDLAATLGHAVRHEELTAQDVL